MDRELIIRLAREAGLKLFNDGWTSSDNGDAVTEESLERFAALVAAHERKPLTDDEIAQALRLADEVARIAKWSDSEHWDTLEQIEAELRRLHAENEALKAELLEQARVNGIVEQKEKEWK